MESENDFSFVHLQKQLNRSMLPSRGWGYTEGNETFFGFQKMEADRRIRKRVAILPNLHAEIYIDDKIWPLSELIIITNVDHFLSLLRHVDALVLNE